MRENITFALTLVIIKSCDLKSWGLLLAECGSKCRLKLKKIRAVSDQNHATNLCPYKSRKTDVFYNILTGILVTDSIMCYIFTVGPMGKAPSAIKTNIKAASQIHPYGRWISDLSMNYSMWLIWSHASGHITIWH